MKTKSLLGAVCAAGVLTAAVAHAGWQYQFASCTKNADGSGYCYGNFTGWRNSSGTGDEVRFTFNGSYRSFYAKLGANNYQCTPNASVTAFWETAMLHRDYFFMQWDASGNCIYLLLDHGSAFGNY